MRIQILRLGLILILWWIGSHCHCILYWLNLGWILLGLGIRLRLCLLGSWGENFGLSRRRLPRIRWSIWLGLGRGCFFLGIGIRRLRRFQMKLYPPCYRYSYLLQILVLFVDCLYQNLWLLLRFQNYLVILIGLEKRCLHLCLQYINKNNINMCVKGGGGLHNFFWNYYRIHGLRHFLIQLNHLTHLHLGLLQIEV